MAQDDRRFDPGSHIYVASEDKKPVTEMYVAEVDDALRVVYAAESLGLGWIMQSYYCPTGDPDEMVREYRVVAWRELMSETTTMVPGAGDTAQVLDAQKPPDSDQTTEPEG